eukprot:1879068-Rhodomonas_salina.1
MERCPAVRVRRHLAGRAARSAARAPRATSARRSPPSQSLRHPAQALAARARIPRRPARGAPSGSA